MCLDRQLCGDLELIVTSRAALFFSCRKFLLRNLYHDLQDLSYREVQSSEHVRADSEFELEGLPTHSNHPAQVEIKANSRKSVSLHSMLARSLFSASFSESCIMFLMLMSQGIDIFRPRYARADALLTEFGLYFRVEHACSIGKYRYFS